MLPETGGISFVGTLNNGIYHCPWLGVGMGKAKELEEELEELEEDEE